MIHHVQTGAFVDVAGKRNTFRGICSCGVIRDSEQMSEHVDAMLLRAFMDDVLSEAPVTILGRRVVFES